MKHKKEIFLIIGKVSLFFLIFFSQNNFAVSHLKWPKEHYTIDKNIQLFFSSFEAYFEKAAYKYVIKNNPRGFSIINGDDVLLRASYRCSKNIHYLNYSNNFSSETFILNSNKLKCNKDLLYLNSKYFIDDFSLELPSVNKFITLKTSKFKKELKTFYNWGTLYLEEFYSKDRLKSKIWFQCEQCDGDVLFFDLKFVDNQQKKSYYFGVHQEIMNPIRFYSIANQWFISSYSRESNSVISELKSQYFWPNVD